MTGLSPAQFKLFWICLAACANFFLGPLGGVGAFMFECISTFTNNMLTAKLQYLEETLLFCALA